MDYNNQNKRYFDNYDNAGGPPFKRQRGSFRGKPNYNNSERQNFNYGGGFYGGGQNFGRGRGSYHGGRGGNRGGFGRGGRGQRGGAFFPRGRFGGGSFRGRGGPRNTSPRRSQNSNVIEVTFPTLNCSYKELLTDVLENCSTVLRPRPVSSACSIEEVKENLALLKEIVIDGKKLNITVSSSAPNPLKRTVQLPEKYAGQTEQIKKFFEAESIEAVKSYKEDRYFPMHILTFASEKAAQDASFKIMSLNGFPLGLKVYYEIETLYSDAEDRTDMDHLDEKAKDILEKLEAEDSKIDAKEDGGDRNAPKNAGKVKNVKEESAKTEEEEAENEEEEAENEAEEAENEEEEGESEDVEGEENEDDDDDDDDDE